MASDFRTALSKRRSYYDINEKSPISDAAIKDIVDYAVLHTPSAFNSQSARVVLLLNAESRKFWEIVRESLRKIVPPANFKPTDDKINSFAAGHGTVLFFEDLATVRKLQEDFPLYKENMPWFSSNSTGMLQHVVWVMLRDAGLGATLQHYGNLVQSQVAETWGLDKDWMLIAQMPFGTPNSEPEAKEKLPLSQTVKVFA